MARLCGTINFSTRSCPRGCPGSLCSLKLVLGPMRKPRLCLLTRPLTSLITDRYCSLERGCFVHLVVCCPPPIPTPTPTLPQPTKSRGTHANTQTHRYWSTEIELDGSKTSQVCTYFQRCSDSKVLPLDLTKGWSAPDKLPSLLLGHGI